MYKRILLSIIFIPAIIWVIYAEFFHGILFFLFVLFLSLLVSREIFFLLEKNIHFRKKSILLFTTPPCVLITAAFINFFFRGNSRAILYIACFVVLFLFIYVWLSYGLTEGIAYFLVFFANFIYSGIFPFLVFLLKQDKYGVVFIYFLFMMSWMNDAAAYFIGTFFGKTKGIVKLSPNKSIEGYIGSFIITVCIANIFKLIAADRFPLDFFQTNIMGLLIAITAPLGDLGESFLKRRADVKDSARFLPGLGGVLDIFDSILLSTPLYFFLLQLFL